MAIYYITFGTYKGLESFNLESSPAALQKSNYVIEKLADADFEFEVITLSETGSHEFTIKHSQTVKCYENGSYTVWTTFGKPYRLFPTLHKYFRLHQLKKFLDTLCSADVVVVYHSLYISKLIVDMKQKKGFKLILELEEIYQDVVECSESLALCEKRVIDIADGFILAVKNLLHEIPQNRPYIVINGTYKTEVDKSVSFNDNKIHCIYAGTFDTTKGGAAAAAATAEFLPSNYHIHILGFGTEKQKNNLLALIDRVQKKAKCTLTYDGLKSGEEYITFLQKCHIGLCTQIPDAKYVETSFPSKILVYLANGLRVLSARIPAVEKSDVGSLINYYNKQSPQEIANAIMKIDINDNFNPREHLKKLDVNCGKALKDLINVVQNENNR